MELLPPLSELGTFLNSSPAPQHTFPISSLIESAIATHRSGDFAKAISEYETLILEAQFNELPSSKRGQIISLLGAACLQHADFKRGETYLQKALALLPKHPDIWSNLALALNHLGRPLEAATCYQRILELRPEDANAYIQLGNALQMGLQLKEAVFAYGQAVSKDPSVAEAYYNRGVALQSLGQADEALEDYRQAIALKPDYAEAHNNIGSLLDKQGNLVAALRHFDQSLLINPTHAGAYANRGRMREMLGDLTGALSDYGQSLSLAPDNPSLSWNRALLMLKCGNYAQGWRLYDQAPKRQAFKRCLSFGSPEWLGDESIAGKRLLIHGEQGFGDSLQFARYALLAAKANAEVLLVVPSALVRLMKTLPGVHHVFPDTEPLPKHDYHCWAVALPLAFKTTLETIPGTLPYFFPSQADVDRWSARMGPWHKPRVGLVWSGNPRLENEALNRADRDRSFPLDLLAPVLSVETVEFYSLQKDNGNGSIVAQLQSGPWRDQVRDWSDELEDFADTAALIQNLDLVITADTSVLHLAGALAKPVWLIDRLHHCWRWRAGELSSPWYPTLRIFRQQHQGNWEAPVAKLAEALRQCHFPTPPSSHRDCAPC